MAANNPMCDTRMTAGISPITGAEREARVEKAQQLMVEQGFEAIILEAGPNLFYFTGITWDRSERMMAAVIPASGAISYVCPRFEESRLRVMLLSDEDVRVWEEDENPSAVVAALLLDRGIAGGRVGVEASLRYFVFEGIRRHSPHTELISADSVTAPCRSEKSMAEIALLQRAADITIEAFKECVSLLRAGMSQDEFVESSITAHRRLGVEGSIVAQFGSVTAFPHGSQEMTCLKPNDMVLMDGGCTIEGYHSDISRTIVFGEPTKQQREMWLLEKAAQTAAFEAIRIGAPIESVDAAAREVIVGAGLGPGYEVPGLPHRTGHGIGLEIHEPPYVVQGNKVLLSPGMCFSNEPMISIPGKFGVRLEDCLYLSSQGPRYLSQPSESLESPFAGPEVESRGTLVRDRTP
ncbi:M24 family metallopeptidase [Candidatus Bipolaricaulota bacterium]